MLWKACRVRLLFSLTLSVLAVLTAHAEHHERKAVQRAEILSLEDRWREAQLAEDVSAMDKLLSDDFLGITASGQVVTKLQQLDRMRTKRLYIRQLTLSDTKIKIGDKVAVVTSLAELDGTAEGRPIHGAFRYIRVYHRVQGDGWRITNFEATRVDNPAVTEIPRAGPGAHLSTGPSFPLASLAKFVSRRPRS